MKSGRSVPSFNKPVFQSVDVANPAIADN